MAKSKNKPAEENKTHNSFLLWLMKYTQLGSFRLIALIGTILVGALGIIDFWLSYKIWTLISPEARIELACPPQVNEHRATIFGRWEGGEPDDIVRIYVAPLDGSNKYWLQDSMAQRGQIFSYTVFLGNSCGFGHQKKDWPIQFEVYAVLLPRRIEASLPGSSKDQGPFIVAVNSSHLLSMLDGLGARAYTQCTITRAEPCNMPKIKQFQNLCSTCDLPRYDHLSLKLSWDPLPEEPELDTMKVELWAHDGRRVIPESLIKNGDFLIVPSAGLFEIKLKHPYRDNCEVTQWVEFLGER